MASWLDIPEGSDFSLQNLPYGIFSTPALTERIGVAVGNHVIDMKILSQEVSFSHVSLNCALQDSTLNAYAALHKDTHHHVRSVLQDLLAEDTQSGSALRDNAELRSKILIPLSEVTMHLPFEIGDYTDFFTSPHHAENCSAIFRPGSSALPNLASMPVAYHGRASSIVISGTPCRRPAGQILTEEGPIFRPCQKLDFEVEFAAFIGRGNDHGCPIDIDEAEDHIFGVVVMNDWSARDIQKWESTPLGPFNGKNFYTTVSPWVVTLEALEPFRSKANKPSPRLSYLTENLPSAIWNIPVRAVLKGLDMSMSFCFMGSYKAAAGHEYLVSECNTSNVSFSFGQMVVHHTAGGCPLRTGDLLATGTLSGPGPETLGCFLELTHNGTNAMKLTETNGGSSKIDRRYLEDGDTVEFHAQARSPDGLSNVGFGSCGGQILPCPKSKYF